MEGSKEVSKGGRQEETVGGKRRKDKEKEGKSQRKGEEKERRKRKRKRKGERDKNRYVRGGGLMERELIS